MKKFLFCFLNKYDEQKRTDYFCLCSSPMKCEELMHKCKLASVLTENQNLLSSDVRMMASTTQIHKIICNCCKKIIIQSEIKESLKKYKTIVESYIDLLKNDADILSKKVKDNKQILQEFKRISCYEKFKQTTIIGMTTTGASKYHRILKDLESSILFVEEAALVYESTIISLLNKQIKHLILIGEHRQLRAFTNVRSLADIYRIDISLFERLINNRLPKAF